MSLYSIGSRVNTAETVVKSKASKNNPTFTGTVTGISKAMVGLGNVDNTTDLDKPISTSTQTAPIAKAPLANPTFSGSVGGISKAMLGLGNVDNTSDLDKSISNLTQTALTGKQGTLTSVTDLSIRTLTTTGNITVNQGNHRAIKTINHIADGLLSGM